MSKKVTEENETKNVPTKKEIRDIKKQKAKRKNLIKSLLISILVLFISSALIYPIFKQIKFGLDLKGGFEILYEVQDIDGKDVSNESVKNTYKTILKRIDILGVSEPEISIEGKNIRIQLAGVKDAKQAKQTLSSMANLTFRNSKDELVMPSDVLAPNGVKVVQDENNPGYYALSIKVANVDVFHKKTEEIRKSGDVLVTWLDFEEGKDSFSNEQAKGTCGSLSNSRCISYASIASELTTNKVQLTGNFNYEEATSLAELINSGSLPTKLVELSSKTVDASFGSDALNKTLLASVVAVAIIVLFLIISYRFSGFVASICVITYTLVTFTIFNLIGGRLTLPSIAAVVIGIGMCVDSAILSFERVKEELRNKKNLKHAFKEGTKSALSSIIDSNITTLLAAIILFKFGESSVKGFATMLIISIFATMFVMVYLLRVLLKGFVSSDCFENKINTFIGIKDVNKKTFLSKFNYVKYRVVYIIISVVIIVVGAGTIYFNGLNLSIDFKGGSSISLLAKNNIKANDIKDDLKELGYEVKEIDNLNDTSVYATLKSTLKTNDIDKIEEHFSGKYKDSTTSIGSISNTVKKELVKNAIKSLIYAIIGIVIYISLRFTFRYGVSAIAALVQDCLIVLAIFGLLRFEVSTIFIAAILSIIGYSINDTIVTFDRIRENKRKLYNDKLKSYDEAKELVNTSIKQTLTRSINTSITTLIPVISLLIFGSKEISVFNYALLIGLIAGTYSSIFIASQVWLMLEKNNIGKSEKKKWYEVDDKDELEELKVKGINC